MSVGAPEAYRWSSAAAHLGQRPDRSGVLDMDFWRRAGGVETWREMHGFGSIDEQVGVLRRCTYAGRPFGDEPFLATMEERFHRRWRRTKADLGSETGVLRENGAGGGGNVEFEFSASGRPF